MSWDVATARSVAGIAAGDTTHDVALQVVMDAVLAEVEFLLERGLLRRRQQVQFYHPTYPRIYLPRYPVVKVHNLPQTARVHYREGWVEGWRVNAQGAVEVDWTGGFDPLPSDLERALWGAFLSLWASSDPLTGAPTASAAVVQGSGEVKSLTVFDAYKVDYDVGASQVGGGSSAGRGVDPAFWGVFAPFASTLMRYRRNVGGA